MNIKELRNVMEIALREEGLEETKLFPKGPKVWTLSAHDIVPFFSPQPIRRSWGFTYGGAIGVEIPSLRAWLQEFKRGEPGIFHSCFVCYLTVNEEIGSEFMVEHDRPIPADIWTGLLKDKLELLPPSLDTLITAYRRNKDKLGWLAHPHQRPAWDFLLRWYEKPDPSMHVPKMLPNGRIV